MPRKSCFSSVAAFWFVVHLATLETIVQGKQVVRIRGRPRGGSDQKFTVFSAVPDSTEPSIYSTPVKGECPEKEGLQVYPDLDQCDTYFKCANGSLTHETCGNGLLFDQTKAFSGAVHNFCAYNWAVDCGDRPSEVKPIKSPDCPYQFGIFPSTAGGCAPTYIKCAFGQSTSVSCDLGLVFDERIRGCNWPDLLIGEQGCDPSKRLGGFACPTSEEQLESDLARRFYPFPRFPVKGRPELYVICVDQQPRLQSCGKGEFDKSTLGCVYNDRV